MLNAPPFIALIFTLYGIKFRKENSFFSPVVNRKIQSKKKIKNMSMVAGAGHDWTTDIPYSLPSIKS